MFESDPYPGKPKILFIGFASSTHTQLWIDLLADSQLNVRLFGLPNGFPPASWKVRTYLTAPYLSQGRSLDPETRKCLIIPPEVVRQELEALNLEVGALDLEVEAQKQEVRTVSQELEIRNQEVLALRQEMLRMRNPVYWIKRRFPKIFGPSDDIFEQPLRDGASVETPPVESRFPWASSPEMCLAQIIQDWRPDIIHTLGLEPASFLYLDVRSSLERTDDCKWIAQARGGPDLALHRLLPQYSERIGNVLTQCDQFIADNQQNYDYVL